MDISVIPIGNLKGLKLILEKEYIILKPKKTSGIG